MYNRYIGNTGKFVRVEESPASHQTVRGPVAKKAAFESAHSPEPLIHEPPRPANVRPPVKNNPSLFGGLSSGLKGLLGGSAGGGNFAGNLSNSFKGMFDHLPFGLEAGDLLLLVMLFFFFTESGDEEFIIILAFFVFSIYKDSKAV